MTLNEQTQGNVVPPHMQQPLSVVPMVFQHSQQGSLPNAYYQHHYHVTPVVNQNHPSSNHQLHCNNNNNDYPNHVQIHPYPHHSQTQFSLHYSSATPPTISTHDNHQPKFCYSNSRHVMDGLPSNCQSSYNRRLKRDTQSCDDLCSSAELSNGELLKLIVDRNYHSFMKSFKYQT